MPLLSIDADYAMQTASWALLLDAAGAIPHQSMHSISDRTSAFGRARVTAGRAACAAALSNLRLKGRKRSFHLRKALLKLLLLVADRLSAGGRRVLLLCLALQVALQL